MKLIKTAEQLFMSLQRMPSAEREKFFTLLGSKAFSEDNLSHDQLFGHLRDDEFSAADAAEYLEISMATFRRYVRAGKIQASSEVGTSHLYRLTDLRALKKALKRVK